MFLANQSLPSASSAASDLFPSAPAFSCPSASATPPARQKSGSLSPRAVARALGLSGMDALTFVAQSQHQPRPLINALLDKLAIQGVAT